LPIEPPAWKYVYVSTYQKNSKSGEAWECLTYANNSYALDAVGEARWLVFGVFLGHGLDTIGNVAGG
jgi:hypothetical protein